VFKNRISGAIRLHVAAASLAQNASNAGRNQKLELFAQDQGNRFEIETNYSII
jgi:hypothetical protein